MCDHEEGHRTVLGKSPRFREKLGYAHLDVAGDKDFVHADDEKMFELSILHVASFRIVNRLLEPFARRRIKL